MALRIEELRRRREGAVYRSPRRIAVAEDGTLVDPADPRARWLLVGEGGELPWDVAARYGLVADGDEGEQPQRKRLRRPEDKRLRETEDKGSA
jgi:hypothetical protein